MKLPPLQVSQTKLKTGYQLIGKAFTDIQDWTGKFGQQQNQHQYPKDDKQISKFGQAINKNLAKFKLNVEVCGLCLKEKQKSEMQHLCKCHHSYCYSCLNSYAITKIEDTSPVKCPQQECSESMHLTSNVYRYLPDSVKLKYLQYKHTFQSNKQYEANRCQRCLQPKHSGECKFAVTPELVEQSFKFRECPKCKVEIRLTSGSRKVSCPRCNGILCYLCGSQWVKGHQCKQKWKIRQLQKQAGYHGCCGCCDCCSYGCENNCTRCGDFCCKNCGSCCLQDLCCDILFSCQSCSPGCVAWNIFSIPVRILLTLLVLTFFLAMLFLFTSVLMLWTLLCVFGAFGVWIQLMFEVSCLVRILMLIFFPISYLYALSKAIAQTHKQPIGLIGNVCEIFTGGLEAVWVQMSPKKCCS